MTPDQLAHQIRITERAYARTLARRDDTWAWVLAMLAVTRRLGGLRVESWKYIQEVKE